MSWYKASPAYYVGLVREDSGCYAWTDSSSEVEMEEHGFFVNKDFEEIEETEGVTEEEEEVEAAPAIDFMAKFANTLALFESHPKVRRNILNMGINIYRLKHNKFIGCCTEFPFKLFIL